jgi:Fic family protein
MTYLWQNANWPSFNWSNSALLEKLVKARFEQGRLLSLPSDFVHSYEISDIKKHIYSDLINPSDLDSLADNNTTAPQVGMPNNSPTQNSGAGLTLARLHGWQASLFPTGFSGIKKIKIAEFRTHDLSRSSLPSKRIADSVQQYLHWWHEPPVELDPVLRSAISFFWFLGISPYDDGNFDLASCLSELALQENEKTSLRKYDLSLQLEENREEVQNRVLSVLQGSGDITDWILYFLDLYIVAVDSAYIIADKNFMRDQFWKRFSHIDLNQRQRKALNHMLEQQNEAMTNRLYVEITKTSRESSKRDLAKLVELSLLKKDLGRGRSCSYVLQLNSVQT